MINLFVYGTMLSELRNHWRVKDFLCAGRFETVERFRMTGDFWRKTDLLIPYVDPYGRASRIRGEVYQIDRKTLKMIDRYEGHPKTYWRDWAAVRNEESGERIRALIYFCDRIRGRFEINDGDFRRFLYEAGSFMTPRGCGENGEALTLI
jgi:gamma-glutamylcyclotransferase (GGCT)/AIG2-like uncharacterized protein YtfP